MSVYLHDIPLSSAFDRLEEALRAVGQWGLLGYEEIPLDERAFGRVLVEAVWAKISSPHYHASAMDGFAVRSSETSGAMPTNPLTLRLGEQAIYVDTGDQIPPWSDAVVPIENVEPLDEMGGIAPDPRRPTSIRIRAALPPWNHVRPMGEDIVATQLVLPAGHTLRPVDLGAIAACGNDRLKVARRPRVAVLPTGSELVPVGQPVRAGDIIEYNSLVLSAQINSWGGEAVRYPITPDNFELIQDRVLYAVQDSDLILLNAGSSAGSEDFSARIVESLGELLVHGVAVRPGHPVILGMLKKGLKRKTEPETDELGGDVTGSSKVPVIGVPGYPVSAALTGEIFVKPLIQRWLGVRKSEPLKLKATLTRKITSPSGDDDYVRVAVGKVSDRFLAAPLSRGAGVITSLVRADGIIILPRGSQGLPQGAEVNVRLYVDPGDLEKTILAIGSHDMILDLLAQFLANRNRRLTSANVGSQGGLVALRRGEAHLAGSHLLDPETGEYNLKYIKEYLPGVPVKLVTLTGRQQGLLVLPGNPKGIRSLEDLARRDVFFVNRQRGAGTRVLLDYQLGRLGIATDAVKGYTQEEFTHLAVAAAVASNRADCGLGIAAAAQALELDFLPLYQERYDLVIPTEHYESPLLSPLLDLLSNGEFRQSVAALPGYDITLMGQLVNG